MEVSNLEHRFGAIDGQVLDYPCVFNDYELYLCKKIHQTGCSNKFTFQCNLRIYYNFLSAFELAPHVDGCTDKFLLGHNLYENKDDYIANWAIKEYVDVKQKIKRTEKKRSINQS